MTEHALHNWSNYLSAVDYYYIIQYVENVKNNVSNDKMIVLSGLPRTGKSTLKNDIEKYLGRDLCSLSPLCIDNSIYRSNNKKLELLCAIEEASKKTVAALINLIKNKHSFIADSQSIERINRNLLPYCRIIEMFYVF